MLSEAERFLINADKAIASDHADSVAKSSRAIELAAKALLRLIGHEARPVHDVGKDLESVAEVLDGKDAELVRVAKRHVARIGWLCESVAPLQQISEYGYAGKMARDVVNETDARTFYDYGQECVGIAKEIREKIRTGVFKMK